MSDDEYCEFHDTGDGDGLVDDEDHHHHEEVFKVQKVAIEKQNANQQMCRFWHDLQKVAIEKPNANQQMYRFWPDILKV